MIRVAAGTAEAMAGTASAALDWRKRRRFMEDMPSYLSNLEIDVDTDSLALA